MRIALVVLALALCVGCGGVPSERDVLDGGLYIENMDVPSRVDIPGETLIVEAAYSTIELTGGVLGEGRISINSHAIQVNGYVIECDCATCVALKQWCARYEKEYGGKAK